jgi:hypothetical protein
VTLASVNDTVQQWNDQSGNGNNASQATAGNRPTFKGAATGLLFSAAGSNAMTCSPGVFNPSFGGEGTTASIMAYLQTSQASGDILGNWDVGNSGGWVLVLDTGGKIVAAIFSTTGAAGREVETTGGGWADGNYHTIGFTNAGTLAASELTIYADGNSQTTTTLLDTAPGGLGDRGVVLGGRYNIGNYITANVKHYVCYNGKLTAAQMSQLHTYFTQNN